MPDTNELGSKDRFTSSEVRLWVRAVTSLVSFVDRFGIAFTVLLLAIIAVKWMGSEATQDDFIRELLFGEITGNRSLAIFFGILIVFAAFGVDTAIRTRLTEGEEMKRLAREKSMWQERALGTKLSHTDDVVE